MLDSNILLYIVYLIEEYKKCYKIDGDYTKDEAIKRLKAWKCENQISVHTYRAIERLKLVRWEYAD